MRKTLVILVSFFAIMLVACTGEPEPTPAPPPLPEATENSASPSDASSMPQFIEFYAAW